MENEVRLEKVDQRIVDYASAMIDSIGRMPDVPLGVDVVFTQGLIGGFLHCMVDFDVIGIAEEKALFELYSVRIQNEFDSFFE